MTVAELIERLQEFPSWARVYMGDGDEVEDVTTDEDGSDSVYLER